MMEQSNNMDKLLEELAADAERSMLLVLYR